MFLYVFCLEVLGCFVLLAFVLSGLCLVFHCRLPQVLLLRPERFHQFAYCFMVFVIVASYIYLPLSFAPPVFVCRSMWLPFCLLTSPHLYFLIFRLQSNSFSLCGGSCLGVSASHDDRRGFPYCQAFPLFFFVLGFLLRSFQVPVRLISFV